jgi:hypothetical protein
MQVTSCGSSVVVGGVGLSSVRLIIDLGCFPSTSWCRTKLLFFGVLVGPVCGSSVVVDAVRGFVGGGGGVGGISGWWWAAFVGSLVGGGSSDVRHVGSSTGGGRRLRAVSVGWVDGRRGRFWGKSVTTH